MELSIITAFDNNQLIGHNNRLPWHIPEDLAYFKKTTLNHPIVMGRKTFESIGKPLPKRMNIIVSATLPPQDNLIILSSPDDLFSLPFKKAFIIGGETLYQHFLPKSHFLYITHIDKSYSGDRFFPKINWDQWVKIKEEIPQEATCRFCVYKNATLVA